MTIDDVKETMLRIQSQARDHPRWLSFANITAISTLDKSTLQVTLQSPDASLISNLVFGILPKKLIKTSKSIELNNFVGCGPFKPVSLDAGIMRLIRNPRFPAPVHLSSIDLHMAQEDILWTRIERGDIDVLLHPRQLDKLTNVTKYQPRLRVVKEPGGRVSYLGMNDSDSRLAASATRATISRAIDRSSIVNILMKNFSSPLDQLWLSWSSQNHATSPLGSARIDPPINLKYGVITASTDLAEAKAIASQLKASGVIIDIQPVDAGEFKAAVGKGAFQIWQGSISRLSDPDTYCEIFQDPSNSPNKISIRRAFDEARRTTNSKKRQELYEQIRSMVESEQLAVFLWRDDSIAVIANRISKVEIGIDGVITAPEQMAVQ